MIKGAKQRCLEQIAYRHWERFHKESEENWKYALKVLNYIDKRISLVRKLLEKK
jgi:hypothetical protein